MLVVLNTLAQPFAAEMRETLKKRLARFVPKPQQNSQPDVCGGTMQPGPYDCGPSGDAFGGSCSYLPRARHENTTDDDRNVRVANNKNVAREREMRRLVTWTDSGMQVPVRGDGVDALPPINYQYLVPCQDILMLAGFIQLQDRLVRFQTEGPLLRARSKERGSVTGLVHAFAHRFDADATIMHCHGGPVQVAYVHRLRTWC